MQSIIAGKKLGANIRSMRKARGLTQDQLAAQLQLKDIDISRGTLAKIEAGIRHISVNELNAIKFLLDMTYEDFFIK